MIGGRGVGGKLIVRNRRDLSDYLMNLIKCLMYSLAQLPLDVFAVEELPEEHLVLADDEGIENE